MPGINGSTHLPSRPSVPGGAVAGGGGQNCAAPDAGGARARVSLPLSLLDGSPDVRTDRHRLPDARAGRAHPRLALHRSAHLRRRDGPDLRARLGVRRSRQRDPACGGLHHPVPGHAARHHGARQRRHDRGVAQPVHASWHDALSRGPGPRAHVHVSLPRLDLRPRRRPARRAVSRRLRRRVRQARPRPAACGPGRELPGLRLRERERGRDLAGRASRRGGSSTGRATCRPRARSSSARAG
jgi:hypothetical protein